LLLEGRAVAKAAEKLPDPDPEPAGAAA
jgi:hypothetical protein